MCRTKGDAQGTFKDLYFILHKRTICQNNDSPWGSVLGAACGILAPRPGIEPRVPTVKVHSQNHWTARGKPQSVPFLKRPSGSAGKDLASGDLGHPEPERLETLRVAGGSREGRMEGGRPGEGFGSSS